MASKRLLKATAVDGIALQREQAEGADKRATRGSGATADEGFLKQDDVLATTGPSAAVSNKAAVPEISAALLGGSNAGPAEVPGDEQTEIIAGADKSGAEIAEAGPAEARQNGEDVPSTLDQRVGTPKEFATLDTVPAMLATGDAGLVERSAPIVGSLDMVDYRNIAGWVWDPTNPDEAIDVEILDDDKVVLKVCAPSFRLDLKTAGFGNGCHGFDLQNLEGIFTLSRHRVRVRRASDGRDLLGSPCWITRPGLDGPAIEFIERAIYSAVAASVTADELAQPLSHLLRALNELINAHAALAGTGGDGRFNSAEFAAELGLTGRTRDLVEQLLSAHPLIHFEPADEPLVSVVMPVHGNFLCTYNCLKSIQEALPKRPFEIIIIDDCSADETLLATLVFSGGVRIVRNPSNLGFVRSCNLGAAEAKGKYVFFLNNDTLVREGWLDELVETFEQVPNVGIAGSKLLFENGQLQEAGGIVWRLGDAWNWGRGRDPNDPAFCFLRDADYVSGAALMIERKLFQDLGGFDERYVPAYYEDTDLAFRVRAAGKRVVVQPASQLVHLEGMTSGTDTAGAGMKRYQVINHGKFYQRWKDTLITHRFNGEQPEQEAERLVRRRAYFIDDSVPTPDQDAGSAAAIAHMRALIELGYKVVFLPADNMSKINPYTAQLEKLGIECPCHPFYWSVEEMFRKSANTPDLVYLHRHSNAIKYATMVRRYFPDCRIVYSVCDLHFLRLERQAQIEQSTESTAQAAAQRRSELAVMQCVDCVIVYSPHEAKLLQEVDPSLSVAVVRWTVPPRPVMRPFADRAGTAFVGGFSHPPNVDAVRHQVSDILPLLRARVPDCTTYVVGSKMPRELAGLQAPGVVALGFVPVLADILHQLRCTVVPLRYGAGLKGKVLDSFAHGLPCVMSEVAAEGLDLPEELAWLIARTPEEFADKLQRVHTDAEFNHQLSDVGLAYIQARYSAAAVNAALADAVAVKSGVV